MAGESMGQPLQGGLGHSGHSLADRYFQKESSHYFGYVYFRQVKDSSMKRGYFQKVSHLGGTAEGRGWRPSGGTGEPILQVHPLLGLRHFA